MAAGKYQESSSSRFSNCKYQVFLSFRGKDTGKNFTDHLYRALIQAGIHTFRDDDEIQRGENIELELQQAIQQSKISIIVFSKNYASSRWCLDKLVMIMERQRNTNSIVLPVFCGVDPSIVSKQTGTFAAAFVEHEKHFKEDMERVNGWRIALKEVGDLAGMVLGDGYEAEFVQSIVEMVLKKLDRKIFHVPLHFIGRDPLVKYINSWLQDGSHGAAIALLYGIGGVGKTAIAKTVYNHNFHKFEGRSFLSNVRERSKESKDVVCLQRQLLSDILNKTVDAIHDVDEGIIKIKDALCCRRSLIVLDDVEKRDQFNAIVGMQNWLHPGSKIIVTTRNKGLIPIEDECVKCKVETLDNKNSLELFSWHAFRQAHPVEDFVEDSWRIVHHCNGLPLALRVIGSSLFGKGRKVWESALHEMEVIPNCEVQKVLGISYDSLDDDCQKNLFLDIACFFNGMDENCAVWILDGLGIDARIRIDNLIDRCLVEIVGSMNDERLWMHQLVRDMGREIARQESPKCQRIWHHMEAFTILKETTDAEKLRGLTLDMYAIMEDNSAEVVRNDSMVRHRLNFFQMGRTSLFPVLSTDAFRKMQNVKFLQLNYMKFYGSYEHFPKNLIWLCWHGFPLKSIPKHFCLEKLVVLDLSRSSLVDAWKGKLSLPNLKILDLRHSHGLIRTPDFSGLPGLEKLILEDCIHLVQIHESIGDLHCLMILNLKNCGSLVELPEEVSRLNSLKQLLLHGCSNLTSLNMELKHHQGRRLLQSDGIVSSISYITSLPLKRFFPFSFSARKSLRFNSFTLPHSLTKLDLSGTPIYFLPESIKDLSRLIILGLKNCKMLQTLPELPSNLLSLNVRSCYSLQRLANLIPLNLAIQCDQLVHIQDSMKIDLIQKADSHMLRIMEMVGVQMQPKTFRIAIFTGVFNVVVENVDKDEMLELFYEEEEEDMWIIQKEFEEYLSFKISSPAAHRICGFDLFTRFCITSESSFSAYVYFEIRNNTSGRSMVVQPLYCLEAKCKRLSEFQSLSHWKLGVDDPTFYNGDDVSISVLAHDPNPIVQIKTVGVLWLPDEEDEEDEDDEEEKDDDDDDDDDGEDDDSSSNDVITSQSSSSNSSNDDLHVAEEEIASHVFRNYYGGGIGSGVIVQSNNEITTSQSSSSNSSDDDVHVAKVEIASHIFRNYYCCFRYQNDNLGVYYCIFKRKVRELIEQ